MTMKDKSNLIWIDLEMTGLDTQRDYIIRQEKPPLKEDDDPLECNSEYYDRRKAELTEEFPLWKIRPCFAPI